MSLRFQAINNLKYTDILTEDSTGKVTAIFGENVFTLKTAREFLSNEAYKSLTASIKEAKKIDRAMASQIATGMRAWAESKGVTHFTHWFQPLIAAALNAQVCEIWTDISGLHNNDPRIVDKTLAVEYLSFDEAAELAYFGAKIHKPAACGCS